MKILINDYDDSVICPICEYGQLMEVQSLDSIKKVYVCDESEEIFDNIEKVKNREYYYLNIKEYIEIYGNKKCSDGVKVIYLKKLELEKAGIETEYYSVRQKNKQFFKKKLKNVLNIKLKYKM